jgi:hypothetical protein
MPLPVACPWLSLHTTLVDRIPVLKAWIESLQKQGYAFVLPDAQGRCNGRNRVDT